MVSKPVQRLYGFWSTNCMVEVHTPPWMTAENLLRFLHEQLSLQWIGRPTHGMRISIHLPSTQFGRRNEGKKGGKLGANAMKHIAAVLISRHIGFLKIRWHKWVSNPGLSIPSPMLCRRTPYCKIQHHRKGASIHFVNSWDYSKWLNDTMLCTVCYALFISSGLKILHILYFITFITRYYILYPNTIFYLTAGFPQKVFWSEILIENE